MPDKPSREEPPDSIQLVDLEWFAAKTNLDTQTLQRLVKKGLAPQPVLISARVRRWRSTDIVRWIERLPTIPTTEGVQ